MEFYGDLERRFNEGTAAVEELEAAGVLRDGGLSEAVKALELTFERFPALERLWQDRKCCHSACLLRWLAYNPGDLNDTVVHGQSLRDAVTSAKQGLPGTMHLLPVHIYIYIYTQTLTPHSTQMRAEWYQAAN